MIRRLFGFLVPVVASAALLALVPVATPANALTILTAGSHETYAQPQPTSTEGDVLLAFFQYMPDQDLLTRLEGGVFHGDTTPPGIYNLRMEWTEAISGDFVGLLEVTDEFGDELGNILFATLFSDVIYDLSIFGEVFGAPPSAFWVYDLKASAVPLPPAALLFLTALGGVGWLGRHKARRLTPA